MNDIKKFIIQLEQRLANATPGPWHYVSSDKIPYENHIENFEHKFVCKGGPDIEPWKMSDEDAEFIASARTDIEILLRLLNEKT